MKYSLLKYTTINIGDEIQSIAASRFIPKIDYYLDRDDIDSSGLSEPSKLIMNGWYSHKPELWPPRNKNIRPLMISFHIADDLGSSEKSMLSPEALDFYAEHGPVGTRDMHTYNLLKEKGVACYFSGCMTLTLISETTERSEEILLTDVSGDLIRALPKEFSRQSSRLWHGSTKAYNPEDNEDRFRYARTMLARYARAKLVITSRLHCALPCLAFGTPVIFLPANTQDVRFKGLLPLFDHVHTEKDIISGDVTIPWDSLKPKGRINNDIPKKIVAMCKSFTGYDKFADI